ncbi:hypothetical protein B6S44_26320 [Bosea sp. Tri-44]|uniref:hypothetical protein n=1 Tax=Bosea sp. Tri-44 TaxID=1972137 RepID=UPI00100FC809|nr:hypothetical protein [Bosea sp. Tri-44]RXT46334.1 hypothetical protein B6S44_26320 [Bosea sp. Tri-44]
MIANPAWAAEAQAFVAWHDVVWVHAYTDLTKAEAGERDQPAIAEIVAEMRRSARQAAGPN